MSLTRWNEAHAAAMVAAAAVAAWLGLPVVLAAAAAVSFAVLLRSTWRAWTSSGTFGVANAVTTVRLAVILGLLAGGLWPFPWTLALLALAVILLDGVDGWAARRFGTQGEFGARYDVAVDSVFVLALSVILLARDTLGPWVLAAGLWHYVYVLAPVVFPTERAEAQRSRWGCTVFVTLVGTLTAAFVVPRTLASASVAIALTAQSVSFARSFWERYGSGRTFSWPAREASTGGRR